MDLVYARTKACVARPRLSGRFFSFKAIAPSLSDAHIKRFLEVDRAADRESVALTEADLVDFVANGLALRKPDIDRLEAAKAAIGLFGQSESGDFLGELLCANALLCGRSGEVSLWRSSPVWVGRVPRERSVFEGAAPKDISRLMIVWSKLHGRPLPMSLLIAISMMRFLQIHPFLDGNGRTARWVALRFARRHSFSINGFDSLILRVWAKGAAFRHACSASIVEEGDWGPWLQSWSEQ